MSAEIRVLAIGVFRVGDRVLVARGTDPASGERFHLENLFAYAGRPRHEVIFVFDARFSDPTWYSRAELPVTEAGTGWEAARWISIQQLAAGPERLVPDGLLSLLQTHVGNDPAAES